MRLPRITDLMQTMGTARNAVESMPTAGGRSLPTDEAPPVNGVQSLQIVGALDPGVKLDVTKPDWTFPATSERSLEKEFSAWVGKTNPVKPDDDLDIALARLENIKGLSAAGKMYAKLPTKESRAQYLAIMQENAEEIAGNNAPDWGSFLKRTEERIRTHLDSMPSNKSMSDKDREDYINRIFPAVPKRPQYDAMQILQDSLMAIALGRSTGADKWSILNSIMANRQNLMNQQFEDQKTEAQVDSSRAKLGLDLAQNDLQTQNANAMQKWNTQGKMIDAQGDLEKAMLEVEQKNIDTNTANTEKRKAEAWAAYNRNPTDANLARVRHYDPDLAPTEADHIKFAAETKQNDGIKAMSAWRDIQKGMLDYGNVSEDQAEELNTVNRQAIAKQFGIDVNALPMIPAGKSARMQAIENRKQAIDKTYTHLTQYQKERLASIEADRKIASERLGMERERLNFTTGSQFELAKYNASLRAYEAAHKSGSADKLKLVEVELAGKRSEKAQIESKLKALKASGKTDGDFEVFDLKARLSGMDQTIAGLEGERDMEKRYVAGPAEPVPQFQGGGTVLPGMGSTAPRTTPSGNGWKTK